MRDTVERTRKARQHATKIDNRCRARGSHHDGMTIIEFMHERNGQTELTKPGLAEALGWQVRRGLSRDIDMARLHRAVNHIKDGRGPDGRPCTGYSLHYRAHSGSGGKWMLIDPVGDLSHHLRAGYEEISGDLQQERARRTINGRRIATAEQMSEWCLKAGDGVGHRLMLEYTIEIGRYGAVSDRLMAEINLWLSGRMATPVAAPVEV